MSLNVMHIFQIPPGIVTQPLPGTSCSNAWQWKTFSLYLMSGVYFYPYISFLVFLYKECPVRAQMERSTLGCSTLLGPIHWIIELSRVPESPGALWWAIGTLPKGTGSTSVLAAAIKPWIKAALGVLPSTMDSQQSPGENPTSIGIKRKEMASSLCSGHIC